MATWHLRAIRVASLICAASLHMPAGIADGGTARVSLVVESYRLTAFTSPTPLQTGRIEVSVLVQEIATGEIVDDAVIELECCCGDQKQSIRAPAIAGTSVNKFLQSATFDLSTAGRWSCVIRMASPATCDVAFDIDVKDRATMTLTVMGMLSIPPLLIGLFFLRESLVFRQRRTLEASGIAAGQPANRR